MTELRFDEPENLAVFVCENVLKRGRPVLYVSHDEDGDWQFLCGGEHGDGDDVVDDGLLVGLGEVVALDPTLSELSKMCRFSEATRDAVGSPWRIHDRMEDIVQENVREYACHVMKVEADGEGPAFAYSIGLTKAYGQPEVISFGLSTETLHGMINDLRDRMALGMHFADGERVSDLLEGCDCVLKRMQKSRYREFLGYALWFNDGDDFDVLQIVWPDKEHRYPWDADYAVSQDQQPHTWHG